MKDIKTLLAEQHRNTRHDAIEIIQQFLISDSKRNGVYWMKMINEIHNLKQRSPELSEE